MTLQWWAAYCVCLFSLAPKLKTTDPKLGRVVFKWKVVSMMLNIESMSWFELQLENGVCMWIVLMEVRTNLLRDTQKSISIWYCFICLPFRPLISCHHKALEATYSCLIIPCTCYTCTCQSIYMSAWPLQIYLSLLTF